MRTSHGQRHTGPSVKWRSMTGADPVLSTSEVGKLTKKPLVTINNTQVDETETEVVEPIAAGAGEEVDGERHHTTNTSTRRDHIALEVEQPNGKAGNPASFITI